MKYQSNQEKDAASSKDCTHDDDAAPSSAAANILMTSRSKAAADQSPPPAAEEETSTTLSWTSSNVSLSPLNPPFGGGAPNNTKEEAQQPQSEEDPSTASTNNEKDDPSSGAPRMADNHPNTEDEEELVQDLLSSLVLTDDDTQPPHGETTSTLPTNGYQSYPEDASGEPVVDESLLQRLLLASSNQHHGYADDEDDDDNAVMLEDDTQDLLHSADPQASSKDHQFFLPQHPFGQAQAPTRPPEGVPTVVAAAPQPATTAALDRLGADDHVAGDDADLLPTQSLLHQFNHHRQPSTIAEEFSESTRRDEKAELLHRPLFANQEPAATTASSPPASPPRSQPQPPNNKTNNNNTTDPLAFTPFYRTTFVVRFVSCRLLRKQHAPHAGAATWIGFWALLWVTCANYVLTPLRDAIALQVGVQHMPRLTLASTVLAVFSSVPIGWLFEAPDPGRRRLWKRLGFSRGETQGSSLALFYRVFAVLLVAYAVIFEGMELVRNNWNSSNNDVSLENTEVVEDLQWFHHHLTQIWIRLGQATYIAFFLVVHLMKLHCLSLVWGVTTEALEYEEVARKQFQKTQSSQNGVVLMESNKMRLQRLSLIGFGGTLGGILGSFLASSMAQILRLPGLLLLAASLLEVAAELSIELGRIMQKHWEGQQLFQSSNDLASLDPSMRRSTSLGSMKRISSGNSLNRVKSTSDLGGGGNKALSPNGTSSTVSSSSSTATTTADPTPVVVDDDTFSQRLMRGLSTILKSRLLMAIFTYNALYASTTVLLSFQRAALVAQRSAHTSVQADTAFLANINMASSAAIFALQSTGAGAFVAHRCGFRGTLALMPLIRLLGVLALAWWHRYSGGSPPNLLIFLVVDECCKIMNLAVAKPVRESLWRGLSNEARYEAKPIVDTLANRWGGGSAAFLVSFVDKTLDLFGVVGSEHDGVRNIFGFPPVLFLCILISAWWAAVSADLGQIRKSIDVELKKRQ